MLIVNTNTFLLAVEKWFQAYDHHTLIYENPGKRIPLCRLFQKKVHQNCIPGLPKYLIRHAWKIAGENKHGRGAKKPLQ